MKKFILIFLIFAVISSMLIFTVNAEEIVKETEKSTNELLSEINQKIEITNYILIFFLIIHFSEKWLKLFLSIYEAHLR